MRNYSVQTIVDVECTRLIGPGSAGHDAALLILLGDVRAIHVTRGGGGGYHGCERGRGGVPCAAVPREIHRAGAGGFVRCIKGTARGV